MVTCNSSSFPKCPSVRLLYTEGLSWTSLCSKCSFRLSHLQVFLVSNAVSRYLSGWSCSCTRITFVQDGNLLIQRRNNLLLLAISVILLFIRNCDVSYTHTNANCVFLRVCKCIESCCVFCPTLQYLCRSSICPPSLWTDLTSVVLWVQLDQFVLSPIRPYVCYLMLLFVHTSVHPHVCSRMDSFNHMLWRRSYVPSLHLNVHSFIRAVKTKMRYDFTISILRILFIKSIV